VKDDWLVALDALLCERWGPRCTVCGATPPDRAELRTRPTGHAVVVTLCAPCDRGDPQRVQLDALQQQRYDA
jgi:hypothetical protein